MNETYKFSKESTLTRTEIESQIKGIDRILKDYDSLIVFLGKFEDDSIHIFDCRNIITDIETGNLEDNLQKIKSELKII